MNYSDYSDAFEKFSAIAMASDMPRDQVQLLQGALYNAIMGKFDSADDSQVIIKRLERQTAQLSADLKLSVETNNKLRSRIKTEREKALRLEQELKRSEGYKRASNYMSCVLRDLSGCANERAEMERLIMMANPS